MQAIGSNVKYGIDVSHHQGTIDWMRVKSLGTVDAIDGNEYPVDFALIKATDGVGSIDPMFRRNAGGAEAVGIPSGFYHYAHPELNSAVAEAESFVSAVAGLKCQLGYVLDIEGKVVEALGRSKITTWALTWLSEVQRRTGKRVLLYTGAYFARDFCGPELGRYPLWVAEYGASKPLDNRNWDKWSIFQFGEAGRVSGIVGTVDFNVMEADFMSKQNDYTGHWAEADIKRVIAAGVMVGDGDGNFRPDDALTRAELATVLCKLGLVK